MKRLIALMLLVLFLGGLTGCNTFDGMGKDAQALGRTMTGQKQK